MGDTFGTEGQPPAEQEGEAMKDTTTATVRTTVNTTVLAALGALLYKIFGWDIKVEDMLPFLPVIAAVVAVFYRLSLAVTAKWPVVGYILFGRTTPPTYGSGS